MTQVMLGSRVPATGLSRTEEPGLAKSVILSSSDPQHSLTQLNSLAGIKARLVSCRAAFCNCFSS